MNEITNIKRAVDGWSAGRNQFPKPSRNRLTGAGKEIPAILELDLLCFCAPLEEDAATKFVPATEEPSALKVDVELGFPTTGVLPDLTVSCGKTASTANFSERPEVETRAPERKPQNRP